MTSQMFSGIVTVRVVLGMNEFSLKSFRQWFASSDVWTVEPGVERKKHILVQPHGSKKFFQYQVPEYTECSKTVVPRFVATVEDW